MLQKLFSLFLAHRRMQYSLVNNMQGIGAVAGAISRNLADLQGCTGSYLSIYDHPSAPVEVLFYMLSCLLVYHCKFLVTILYVIHVDGAYQWIFAGPCNRFN